MMLRHSFELEDEASAIENAVTRVLEQGYRTKDIMSTNMKLVGTKEMGTLITSNLTKNYTANFLKKWRFCSDRNISIQLGVSGLDGLS